MHEWSDGSDRVIAAVHPARHALTVFGAESGYQVEYRRWMLDGFEVLSVRVKRQDLEVASADFTDEPGYGAYCQNIRVLEGHRRKGLANGMYVFTEEVLWRTLIDYWGEDEVEYEEDDGYQSAAARGLWAQPDRPFGHPLPER